MVRFARARIQQDPAGSARVLPRSDDVRSSPPTPQIDPPARVAMFCDRGDEAFDEIRTAVAAHCADRLASDRLEAVQTVVADLVSLALSHQTVGLVTLDLSVARGAASVTVDLTGHRNNADAPRRSSLDDYSETAHGLALTRTIADSVEVNRTCGLGSGRDWISVTARVGAES